MRVKGKKEKYHKKKRKIAQEKESGERKLVNFPNEKGVGVVHPLMEKPEEKKWWCPRWCSPFPFCLKGQI